MDVAAMLDRAMRREGHPILGVSIGNPADKSTWVVTYAPEANDEQIAAGAVFVQAYDPATDTVSRDEDIASRFEDFQQRVFRVWLAGKFGITPLRARQELLAIAQQLIAQTPAQTDPPPPKTAKRTKRRQT